MRKCDPGMRVTSFTHQLSGNLRPASQQRPSNSKGVFMCDQSLAVQSLIPQPEINIRHQRPGLISADKFVLVDGANLMRIRGGEPRLTNLLTVLLEVARKGGDWGCVFDANTRHILRKAGRANDAEAYEYLLRTYGAWCAEVTGGTRADDVILAEADYRSALVVSNDRFEMYSPLYPWIINEPSRVLHVNHFRGRLHFDGCILPLRSKLDEAVADLEQMIKNLTGGVTAA
jgi:hypothetical protein